MNLLAMDTSGPVAGVSLIKENQVVYEGMAINRFTHSVSMMPMVEESFLHTGMSIDQLDALAVTVGPGSFTGVRIGVSTVKGLAHGASKPCIAVDALEALAMATPYFDGIICPIQDARAGQVYAAAFKHDGSLARLMKDEALKLDDYLEKIQDLGQRFWFTGDGLGVHRETIVKTLGDAAILAPSHMAYLRPAAVAMLALEQKDKAVDYLSLEPLYLRAPQAQRERAAREGRK